MLTNKIILIQEDKVLASLIAHYLRSKGFHIVQMSDAHKLQSMLPDLAPDLIICDLLSPCTTRLALGARDTETGKLYLPLILTSKMNSENARAKATFLGAHVFMPQPLDVNKLFLHIQTLLDLGPEQKTTKNQKHITLC